MTGLQLLTPTSTTRLCYHPVLLMLHINRLHANRHLKPDLKLDAKRRMSVRQSHHGNLEERERRLQVLAS